MAASSVDREMGESSPVWEGSSLIPKDTWALQNLRHDF